MCYGNPLGACQKYIFSGEKLHRKCFAHSMAQINWNLKDSGSNSGVSQFLLYGDNITNLDLLQSPDCVKMEIYEAERGKVQWCIHCNSVSATVRAYPLGSCWKSGGCLIGWWRGHMGAPPERHQGPSTFQWGQPLLKSRLGDHPHLQVWISSLLDSRSDPSLQIVSINLASQLRLGLAMRDLILNTENTILIRINW